MTFGRNRRNKNRCGEEGIISQKLSKIIRKFFRLQKKEKESRHLMPDNKQNKNLSGWRSGWVFMKPPAARMPPEGTMNDKGRHDVPDKER